MADRKVVAKKDGAFRTNRVTVEPGYFLAPGYELAPFDQKEIGDTGHHKVLRILPSNEQAEDPRFLGRWDEKEKALDFDLVDRQDRVQKVKPHGHHSKDLGHRRFEVEIGLKRTRSSSRASSRSRLVSRFTLGMHSRSRSSSSTPSSCGERRPRQAAHR